MAVSQKEVNLNPYNVIESIRLSCWIQQGGLKSTASGDFSSGQSFCADSMNAADGTSLRTLPAAVTSATKDELNIPADERLLKGELTYTIRLRYSNFPDTITKICVAFACTSNRMSLVWDVHFVGI